jgi:capsular exopolysaccharide synthesis family protein
MARSASDPTVALPASPFQTPATGMAQPVPVSPFNYTNQPNMPAPAVPATPTPTGLINAFRRRWVLGTFLGALVAAATAIGVWAAMPGGKHQVRALVQLRARNTDIVGRSTDEFAEYRNRQKFLLKTRDLITRTLANPAVASLDSVKNNDNPVQMVEDQLRVAAVADDILEVSMTGNNLDDMKVIVDHLVKNYVEDATGADRRLADDRRKKLDQLSETLKLEIENQEKQIALISAANNTTGGEDSATKTALLQARLFTAESEHNKIGREMIRLEAELNTLRKLMDDKNPKGPNKALVEQIVLSDPRVLLAQAEHDRAKKHHEDTLKTADGNTELQIVQDAKTEWEKATAGLAAAKKNAAEDAELRAKTFDAVRNQDRMQKLLEELATKKEERDRLKEMRDALDKAIKTGVVGGGTIQMMRDALKPQREALDKVNLHLSQMRVNNHLDDQVRARGDVEKVPNNNQARKLAMAGFGGVGSFFAVVLLVAFLEWRTRRVDGVDQVVTELGLRVIGTVPAFPNRANLKAAVEAGGANWRFVLNESINSARTMLLHTARTQSMQVVMVTSATQGEGKTSLASQLATSMATAGMRTLIVDGDLRNPSIQKLFELPLGPGVSEVLRQEIDVSDAIQATAVPNLWVLSAGQCSNATIAALAQGHPMETLFNRLRGQFDFIIVDSCPVLPVADALLIGQHVDGVVFSIMQDISQLPKVMTATEKLNQLNIPLVGAVVNGIKQDVYSYGYNYVKQLPA